MTHLNRDTVIAVIALAGSGVLGWSSLSIRDPGYGTMGPGVWPQIVVIVFALSSAVYLVQSLRAPAGAGEGAPGGLVGLVRYYRNPILCFAIYLVYLWALPVLGALIGGVLLVFLLLNVLGGWSPGRLAKHAAIAVVSMGFMWSLFTFGLRVILPQGTIFTTL